MTFIDHRKLSPSEQEQLRREVAQAANRRHAQRAGREERRGQSPTSPDMLKLCHATLRSAVDQATPAANDAAVDPKEIKAAREHPGPKAALDALMPFPTPTA